MIDKFLVGNKRFIQEDFTKNVDYYKELANGQSPTALWIGCSDSRVDPERVADARMGEIFVHRNIGNIVSKNDLNIATVLEYAVKHLKVDDIVVYGHSDCGAMKALDKGAEGDEYVPKWLENSKDVKAKVDAELKPATTQEEIKERKKYIEVENIRFQLDNLRSYSLVKKAEEAGEIALHGLYYDLETGELSKVV
jgi:carbonic anhydrase